MPAIFKSAFAWVTNSLMTLLTADTESQTAGDLAGMDWFIL